MKKIRHILVAVKNPDEARQLAVTRAVELAKSLGASLELFHALSTQSFFEVPGLTGRNLAQLRRQATAARTEKLEAMALRIRRAGVTVRATVAWESPPHEAVIRRARDGADLIVAGVHEGDRGGSWFLKLTDWELLRASPVPVLLVKSTRRWRGPVVVAAVDPSHARSKPSGLDATIVEAAKTLERQPGGELALVHANYPEFNTLAIGDATLGALAVKADYDRLRVRAADQFEKFARRHRIAETNRHLVTGDPETVIPKAARKLRADVVVMGAVARSAIKRFLIGNTAERVLNALPCDVLVVQPGRRAKGDRS